MSSVDWELWLIQEFDRPLEREIVSELAEALERFRNPSIVRNQLMKSSHRLHRWLGSRPELVAHVDPTDWAQGFAESWGWTVPEPIEFLN